MKTHKLVQSWEKNISTLDGWLAMPSAFGAEIMAHQGFDSLTIDMQHGINDYLTTVDMIRAINTTSVPTIVRVPWLDAAHIMKTLDAGASGIICPMINNKKEAEKLCEYAYYAPIGRRSFGPVRANFVFEGDYAKNANNSLLIIAMIETQEALDNLDDILSVEGIDAIFIGPADLSLSLGYTPKFDQEEPFIAKTIEHILKTAKKHNKYAGIYNATVQYAMKMSNLGFNFVTVGSDAGFITQGSSEVVNTFKNRKVTSNDGTSY